MKKLITMLAVLCIFAFAGNICAEPRHGGGGHHGGGYHGGTRIGIGFGYQPYYMAPVVPAYPYYAPPAYPYYMAPVTPGFGFSYGQGRGGSSWGFSFGR